MKNYYDIAFNEAIHLVKNWWILAALHCLFSACIVIPCYILLRLSLIVAMFPLWVSGRIRKALS